MQRGRTEKREREVGRGGTTAEKSWQKRLGIQKKTVTPRCWGPQEWDCVSCPECIQHPLVGTQEWTAVCWLSKKKKKKTICGVCWFHRVKIPTMAGLRYQYHVPKGRTGKRCTQLVLAGRYKLAPAHHWHSGTISYIHRIALSLELEDREEDCIFIQLMTVHL